MHKGFGLQILNTINFIAVGAAGLELMDVLTAGFGLAAVVLAVIYNIVKIRAISRKNKRETELHELNVEKVKKEISDND